MKKAKKLHTVLKSRLDKSTEIESILVVSWGRGWVEKQFLMDTPFLFGMINFSKLRLWW